MVAVNHSFAYLVLMYQRVAEAPPTALESAEISDLTHHVREFILTLKHCYYVNLFKTQ